MKTLIYKPAYQAASKLQYTPILVDLSRSCCLHSSCGNIHCPLDSLCHESKKEKCMGEWLINTACFHTERRQEKRKLYNV